MSMSLFVYMIPRVRFYPLTDSVSDAFPTVPSNPISLVSSRSAFGPHSLVWIRLPQAVDIKQVRQLHLATNNVSKAATPPRFVEEFTAVFRSKRFSAPNVSLAV